MLNLSVVFPLDVHSHVVSHCDPDEECMAIELCEYESQIAYEGRFNELKFCGVYLVDVRNNSKTGQEVKSFVLNIF